MSRRQTGKPYESRIKYHLSIAMQSRQSIIDSFMRVSSKYLYLWLTIIPLKAVLALASTSWDGRGPLVWELFITDRSKVPGATSGASQRTEAERRSLRSEAWEAGRVPRSEASAAAPSCAASPATRARLDLGCEAGLVASRGPGAWAGAGRRASVSSFIESWSELRRSVIIIISSVSKQHQCSTLRRECSTGQHSLWTRDQLCTSRDNKWIIQNEYYCSQLDLNSWLNDIMKVVLTLRVTAVSLILLPDMTELSAAEEIWVGDTGTEPRAPLLSRPQPGNCHHM